MTPFAPPPRRNSGHAPDVRWLGPPAGSADTYPVVGRLVRYRHSNPVVAQLASGLPIPDRLYRGEISTAFDRRVIPGNRIAYVCEQCGGQIDVPTGTEFCGKCSQQTEG